MNIQASSKAIKIRRFVAIILVILSIVCLFWPSIINIRWDSRDEYIHMAEEYEKAIKDKSRNDQLMELKQDYQGMGLTKGDAKRAADALLTIREYNTETEFSFWKLRTYFSAYMTYLSVMENNGKTIHADQEENDMETVYTVFGIVLNVLFFLLPVLGIGAIVAFFFNRTQAAGYVYAGFALLTTGTLVTLMILLKERGSDLTAPGVALFLLPLFAIGSGIVYQRDRIVKNVFAKKGESPTRAAAASDPWNRSSSLSAAGSFENTQRPVTSRVAAPRIKWTCPHCNSENMNDSAYCDYCGNPKPGKFAFCVNCGEQITAGKRFCPYCGAEQ